MNKKVSCIIPFLNERGRITKVLDEIVKCRHLGEIIAVDGCSKDGGFEEIRNFSGIRAIRLEKNIGKTGTVETGLKITTGDYILFFDADLTGVDSREIDKVIEIITGDGNIDMIIFNRRTNRIITRLNRMELLFSGERILKRKDLLEILKTKPVGFQLETAINTYMIKNKKNVLYFDSSNTNLPKTGKFGIIRGLKNDIKMFWEVFKYDPLSYLNQMIWKIPALSTLSATGKPNGIN